MKSRDLPRFALSLVFVLGLTTALTAGPVPSNKPLHFPDWWFLQDVIVRVDPGNLTPNYNIPGTYQAADDFATANIGQLKAFSRGAYDELVTRLPGEIWDTPAGSAVRQRIRSWYQDDALTISVPADNFILINQGQLKAVAAEFLDVLTLINYERQPFFPGSSYAWTPDVADDDSFAAANLGQLKFLFSFSPNTITMSDDFDGDGLSTAQEVSLGLNPFAHDTDRDGLPDGWEFTMNLSPLAADALADPDGDGVPNQEDARPRSAAVGRLTVSIAAPTNGGNL